MQWLKCGSATSVMINWTVVKRFTAAVIMALITATNASADEKIISVPSSQTNLCQRFLNAIKFGNQRSTNQNEVAIVDPLIKLRDEFGPELRRASDFEIEYIHRGTDYPNHTNYWYAYNGLEVKFCNAGGSYGQWLLRTKDKQNYFALAAQLPKSREIAQDILPTLVPDGFALSSDKAFFIPQNTKDNGYDYQPTVATLNKKHRLNSKLSPVIFVTAANSNMTHSFQTNTSLEFLEFLSRGEIPIAYGWPYAANVRIAEAVLQLTKTTEWSRFVNILVKAQRAEADESLMAHKRWQANRVLSKAYWLIVEALYPAYRKDQLTSSEYFNQGLPDLEKELAALIGVQSPSEITPKINKSGRKDSSYLKLRPIDLALFMNDWKFTSIRAEDKQEYSLFWWLKTQISRDYSSSGNSIPYERLQLRTWTYLQLPVLNEIEIPDYGSEGYDRWVAEVTQRLGTEILLLQVPYAWTDEYYQQAAKIYYENFWAGSLDKSAKDGHRFNRTQTLDPSVRDALTVLGFQSDIETSDLTLSKIKTAYRIRAFKLHPDHNNSSSFSEEQMKRLNNAKDIVLRHFMFEASQSGG